MNSDWPRNRPGAGIWKAVASPSRVSVIFVVIGLIGSGAARGVAGFVKTDGSPSSTSSSSSSPSSDRSQSSFPASWVCSNRRRRLSITGLSDSRG